MSLLRRILPHHCPLCLSSDASHRSKYICQECIIDLPRNRYPCSTCGLPLKTPDTACPDCIRQPKPYTLTISPLLYSHPVDHLIHQLKTKTPHFISQQLSPLLHPLITDHYSKENWPDALIPVPLHWYTKLKRGFNQAHCMADSLSSITGIPCMDMMHRHQRNRIQKSLNRKNRLLNLNHSFNCSINITGMHVVIVDDVVTSCATVINIANTLLAAGAARVDVWAFARTPKPKH